MFPKLFSDDPRLNDRAWLAWIIVLLVGMLGTMLGVTFPIPPLPPTANAGGSPIAAGAQGITHLADLSVSSDLTVGDDATASDLIALDYLRISAQTSITATTTIPIAPTGAYQPVIAADAVSTTVAAGTAGDLLILINIGTPTVTISDTGTMKLTANVTLGQYDSLMLWCDGTHWIELGKNDN